MVDFRICSLNPEKGLGVASLSVVYGSLIISSLFISPIIIQKIGCKWTLVASICCYVIYSVGNFKPNWYSLIITSAILGLGAGPLWVSKGTYVTASGILYAKHTGKENKDIVNQYFGIFFLLYQSSGVWGNLISSLVLMQKPVQGMLENVSYSHCGAKNCPITSVASNNFTITSSGVSDPVRYTLMGIYTGCGVIAVIIVAAFLDQINLEEEEQNERAKISICQSLLATTQQLKDKRQCLLIPLTMFTGFQPGFLSSDYTKAYVTCSLGIHFVGYVMICSGAMNSLCSLLFGKLSEYTGRLALFILAAAISISCITGHLLWSPNPNQLVVFFIFPALWSISDAICQTLLNALYGVLFDQNKEAAFANFRLWQSVGFIITFAYSNYLCVYVKLYVVLSVMLLGMLLYLVVEFLEYKKQSANAETRSTTTTITAITN
ncbi:protein unc-93 homolog A-like isoform 2-T2 [Discoglossus pictus]